MFPMDKKPTPVRIEYSRKSGQRVVTTFPDAFSARRFYAAKDRAGANPKVFAATTRSDTMPAIQAPTTVSTPVTEATTKAHPAPEASTPTTVASPAPKAKAPAKAAAKAPVKAATPKAAAAPKAAAPKAAAPKKAEAKPEAKPEAKAEAKADKPGLRKPQVRILLALLKQDNQTRKSISATAPADFAMLNSYLGAHDEEVRAANDAKNFPCLLTLGYIKAEQHDIDGKDVIQYHLTAAGRKVAAKLS